MVNMWHKEKYIFNSGKPLEVWVNILMRERDVTLERKDAEELNEVVSIERKLKNL